MNKEKAPENIDDEYVLIRYLGFNWRYRKYLNRRGIIDFEVWGPLCSIKSCIGRINNPKQGEYICVNCNNKTETPLSHSELTQKVHSKIEGEWARGLKFSNLDKLPAINEKLEEKNKFYKVAVEHDPSGKLRDVHILIGKKSGKGKKVHIIISQNGEIRLDKKDLHPSKLIKSITSIIYK